MVECMALNKIKILAPVGNFESLKMAVFNGADEVYLGITDFNARSVNGFSLEQLKDVVDFAHLYNVKVNLAINILFKDSELQNAVNIIVDAFNMGVDHFIIQDFGLITLLHSYYPDVVIHASTQMGIHNLEGVKFLEKYGVKRVVLSRETPLNEIKRIRENSNIEIEYFCHGALCISFSGNCYLSSYLQNASGNRGKCKQLCRLPYAMKFDNKKIADGYLLSAKDFNMLDRLEDLSSAGVDVIKIEGRARRPYYVGAVCKAYRSKLDGRVVDLDSIKLAFNRDYTEGYFNGNGNIISKFNNHIGIKIGRVTKVNKGKKFNEVFFETAYPVTSKAIFKVMKEEKEVSSFTAFDMKEVSKNTYVVTTTNNIPLGDLHLIVDEKKENEMLNMSKKINVKITINASVNKNIFAKVKCGNIEFETSGEVCQQSINSPLTKNDFIDCFSKSEYFSPQLSITMENIFLTKKTLNEFRRTLYQKLYEKLTYRNFEKLEKIKITTNHQFDKLSDVSCVKTLSNDFLTKSIIFSPETYTFENVQKFVNKCKEKRCKPYLDLPNFATSEDITLLKDIIEKTKVGVVVNNYYALDLSDDKIIGWGLNVYNSVTASEFGVPVMCAESGISLKQKAPFMTLRACPFKSHMGASCNNCPYKKGYYLEMQNGTTLNIERKKLSSCMFFLE